MYSKPRISYISQFFIFLGLMFASFLFAGALALVIWKMMVGGDLLQMEKQMLDPANANAIKIVQLVSSFAMFLLPALIFARIVNKDPLKHVGLKTKFNWIQVGLVAIMIFVGIYLSGALAELTNYIPISAKAQAMFKKWEKTYTDQVMVIANMKNIGDYLYTLIVIALAPAIFEEVVFRGVLQQILVKGTRIPWLGIIITAIIFSMVHASFYGFLSRAALGIMLGYLFHYSKSLWLPIIAHFINNGFAVTAMYIMSKQGKLSAAAMDEKFPIWWGIPALGIILVLFIFYRNESKKLGTYYRDNTATKDDNPFAEEPVTIG